MTTLKTKKWTMVLLLIIAGNLSAQVKLPLLFSNNMVLQQGIQIPVWGWASPGEKITVTFDRIVVSAKTTKDGKWSLKLPAIMEYGGPHKMTVKGKNTVSFENVLIGEVWVCSGQSNMEFNLITAKNGEAEIAASSYPDIRLFTVKRRISQTPQEQLQEGSWLECSPATSHHFSAVAYFFARELYNKLKVPIGLIHSSWGGTNAETWMSNETASRIKDFEPQLSELKKIDLDNYAKTIENEVRTRVGEFSTVDLGMKGDQAIWAAPELDDSSWKLMNLPGYIENNGLAGVDGIIWFRKTIEISPLEAGKPGTLSVAKVNDSDHTYINGILIGSTILQAEKSRVYNIPVGVLKAGKNVLTVQVEDVGGMGGIYGDSAALKLECQNHTIHLSGNWKYKVGLVKFSTVLSPNSYPTLLYNGMINPLVPFGIRGAIWYQGESNAGRAKQYQRVFPGLIKDWRMKWNQGDFPFFFVQLANFMKADSLPVESSWAELREAQTMTLALPNTGMAVATDIGDALDIHPKDKQTVGKRLALSALKVAFKQDVIYSGPVYKEMKINGNKITLSFDQAGSGLKIRDKYGYIKGFAVAGEDHKFYWATAKLTGPNTLKVTSPEVQNPVAVRYAWGNNPDDANLYNSADLPASSFRTDKWKGITE